MKVRDNDIILKDINNNNLNNNNNNIDINNNIKDINNVNNIQESKKK